MADNRISGTLAAAVTPLRDAGDRLDEEAFGPLLEFYAAGGLDGLLVLGTTGEGILLAESERRRAAELAVSGARGLRVVVHCGAQSTPETCRLAAHAAEAGADGVAVIAPPYYRFASEELVEHFVAAAQVCAPLPFYLYEYADRSGYAIPVAVVQSVGERASNLTGMKVSDAPFARLEPYLATKLDIFSGAEGLVPRGLEAGAVGAVSGVAAAFPETVSALVRAPRAGQVEMVESLRAALSAYGFQASVKATLGLRGVPIRPDVRAPLLPLSAAAAAEFRGGIEAVIGPAGLAGAVRA